MRRIVLGTCLMLAVALPEAARAETVFATCSGDATVRDVCEVQFTVPYSGWAFELRSAVSESFTGTLIVRVLDPVDAGNNLQQDGIYLDGQLQFGSRYAEPPLYSGRTYVLRVAAGGDYPLGTCISPASVAACPAIPGAAFGSFSVEVASLS